MVFSITAGGLCGVTGSYDEKYVILAKSVFSLSLLSFAFWALLTLVNGAEITESYPSVYFYISILCVNRKIRNYISLISQIHLRNQ